MTYSFGTEPAPAIVDSTPETSRWYKLTPGVIAWLQATRAQDAGVRDLLKRAAVELVFMGISATGEDLFWVTATSSGNMGGDYKTPAASDSPVMTYEQVLAVFAPRTGGPLTKRTFPRATPAPNRTGLYIGIAAGAVAFLGLVYLTREKKAAPVAKNPRDRLSLRDRSRKRRRGELEWPPWGTAEEVEAVEVTAPPPEPVRRPGIATRIKTVWSRGAEKQVLYRLSPPYRRGGDSLIEYVLSSSRIIDGRAETLVFDSDPSGQLGDNLWEAGGLYTLDNDQSIRDLGYTVVPAKSSSLAANRRRKSSRRVKRNSSFGPVRDSAAARARAAFARGDGAAANRALAELRAIDIGLMPRAMKRNVRWENERGRDWRERQSIERRNQWSQLADRESRAVDLYLALIQDKAPARSGRSSTVYPGATPADRAAAVALVAEQYPSVNLREALTDVGLHHIARDVPVASRLSRNPAYAIPERHAYPITTAKDAYHATQRLKQGRVKSEEEAKRIIAAIKHRHPEIWREYLAGYPVSKVIASKRKGLAARHRS